MESVWENIQACADHLDSLSPHTREQRQILQVIKIMEELGEAAQAIIGATGSSPRKGHSHTWSDVHDEVCDVIITGMVTLARMTDNPQEVFERHLKKQSSRTIAPFNHG